MTIWIVKKHPRDPHSYGNWFYLETFTIFSTHATRKEAQEVAAKKMLNRNTIYLYAVGKVQLKEKSK